MRAAQQVAQGQPRRAQRQRRVARHRRHALGRRLREVGVGEHFMRQADAAGLGAAEGAGGKKQVGGARRPSMSHMRLTPSSA